MLEKCDKALVRLPVRTAQRAQNVTAIDVCARETAARSPGARPMWDSLPINALIATSTAAESDVVSVPCWDSAEQICSQKSDLLALHSSNWK
eukprot:scaffold218437_cov28-Tisochrysis_lutea.AAC.8